MFKIRVIVLLPSPSLELLLDELEVVEVLELDDVVYVLVDFVDSFVACFNVFTIMSTR